MRRNLFIWIAIAGVVGAFCSVAIFTVWTRHLPFAEWREVLDSLPMGGQVEPNDPILPATDPLFARSQHEAYAVEVERHVAADDWARLEARLPLGIVVDDTALRRAGCNLARAVRADPAMAAGGLPGRFVLKASGEAGEAARQITFALADCGP